MERLPVAAPVIAALVILILAWTAAARTVAARTATEQMPIKQLALTCTAKDPPDLKRWVSHHRSLGIERFYIYLDECNGPQSQARRACSESGVTPIPYTMDWVVSVSRSPPNEAWDQPRLLIYKQAATASDAIDRAARDDVGWLFHVDSDELLYPTGDGLRDALDRVPSNVLTLKIDNWEVVPEGDHRNCFEEATLFRTDKAYFRHYINGKGACRPSARIKQFGPHRFVRLGSRDADALLRGVVVLHYVSCNRESMRQKYVEMGQFSSFFGRSSYHKRNMSAARHCEEPSATAKCELESSRRFAERMGVSQFERLERVNIKRGTYSIR